MPYRKGQREGDSKPFITIYQQSNKLCRQRIVPVFNLWANTKFINLIQKFEYEFLFYKQVDNEFTKQHNPCL